VVKFIAVTQRSYESYLRSDSNSTMLKIIIIIIIIVPSFMNVFLFFVTLLQQNLTYQTKQMLQQVGYVAVVLFVTCVVTAEYDSCKLHGSLMDLNSLNRTQGYNTKTSFYSIALNICGNIKKPKSCANIGIESTAYQYDNDHCVPLTGNGAKGWFIKTEYVENPGYVMYKTDPFTYDRRTRSLEVKMQCSQNDSFEFIGEEIHDGINVFKFVMGSKVACMKSSCTLSSHAGVTAFNLAESL
jgi:hypothetical protein